MTRHQETLATLLSAGYHADSTLWEHTYLGSGISFTDAIDAWRRGRDIRAAGIAPCPCFECAVA